MRPYLSLKKLKSERTKSSVTVQLRRGESLRPPDQSHNSTHLLRSELYFNWVKRGGGQERNNHFKSYEGAGHAALQERAKRHQGPNEENQGNPG